MGTQCVWCQQFARLHAYIISKEQGSAMTRVEIQYKVSIIVALERCLYRQHLSWEIWYQSVYQVFTTVYHPHSNMTTLHVNQRIE